MPFLSVIIPVYKVEKYLAQCVDSVINQNLENIEIILVDDGSPDNCPIICDEYSKRISFIKVIHKKNGGLSSARNEGIKAATGDYLMFMDSDDWWNSDVKVSDILLYVKRNTDVDMFLFTSLDYIDGEGFYKRSEHNNFKNICVDSIESYYNSLIANGNMEVSANTKILKTDFIKSNGLYFKENLLGEDNEWIIRLLRVIKKVDKIEQPLYLCRLGREDSITNSIKQKNISDLLYIVSNSMSHNQKIDSALKEYELCFSAYLWFCAMGLCAKLSKKERKAVHHLFKETSDVCRYSNSKKTKLSNFIYKFFGFNITVAVLGKYIHIRSKKRNLKYGKRQ